METIDLRIGRFGFLHNNNNYPIAHKKESKTFEKIKTPKLVFDY